MVNYKDIKLALVEIIKVTYSQGTKKYDKMGLSYVGYLKTMQRKRDPDDHCRYIAKQRSPNEEVYNERMADFKDWYNKEKSNSQALIEVVIVHPLRFEASFLQRIFLGHCPHHLLAIAHRLPPFNSPGLSKYLTKTSWDNLGSSNPIGPSRGLEALERYVLFFELQQEKYPKVKLQNCQALQEKLEGFLPKLDSAQ
uniref:Uncharacterized protein n=1 Tax=Rhizophagus irregularis (strain DAOM 181602 / DAOM 197198 / MUCL 43194) TaxID=747089 RepID=U9T858_RHIID